MITALALVVPALLVAALAARRPVPTDPQAAGLLARDAAWQSREARRVADGVELVGLAVRLDRALFDTRPDVLAYWSAERTTTGGAWPGQAHLLGSAADGLEGFLRLPEQAAETDGWLVLYSLAHAEVVAELQLPTARNGR